MTPPLDLYWSGWLELAIAGLVAGVVYQRELSGTQLPAQCAKALAGKDRTAVLHATCIGSDSSWARLVRAALRDRAPFVVADEGGGYRTAPQRASSDVLTSVAIAERARLSRQRRIGHWAVAASIVSAWILVRPAPVITGFFGVAGLLVAWRIGVSARRARAALDEALRALPSLVESLPPPPEPRALPAGAVTVRTVGLLNMVFVGLISGVILLTLLGGLVVQAASPVPAGELVTLFIVHVMMAPFLLILFVGLSRESASFDAARGELVLVRSVLRMSVGRTIVPVEIIDAFEAESRRVDRLYIKVDGERRLFSEGALASAAARTFNEALGLPRKKKRARASA